MNSSDLKLFIATPDSYSDVMEVFLQCFRKNWSDCPYELIVSTNTKNYDDVTTFDNNIANDGWMDRTIPILKQLDADYIMLLCDDCFMLDKVSTQQVKELFNEVKSNHLDFCGMTNYIKGPNFAKAKYLNRVPRNRAYAKNLQTGIFRREYLLTELGDGSLSPWEMEAKWLREASQDTSEYFTNIASCNVNILHCTNGIVKGKWLQSAINDLNDIGIPVKTERKIISINAERKMKFISKMGKFVPMSSRKRIKNVLKHIGFNFATNE